MDWLGTVTKSIAAGRGFIGLANMVFSNWNPLVALGGAFLFGFFDNLSFYIQNNPWLAGTIPWQFIATLPYVVTLLVVAGIIGKAKPPKAERKTVQEGVMSSTFSLLPQGQFRALSP